jgi:Ni,Fe-hydrogenase I large subunit
MASKIVIDPVTRIEGHLRMETSVENGVVNGAWSTGTLFRGVEMILKNRDPRDAWMMTQRICGVCTYVHASASIKCMEDSLGLTIPENARLVRNILMAAQYVQDHIIHFYHLHALDWVDVVSALGADPADAATADAAICAARSRSVAYFTGVKDKLATFASKGQLGPFANGYWGHPAYKLTPAQNLVLVSNYLEALTIQNEIIKIHALLGGKNPHPQSLLIGGITQDWSSPPAISRCEQDLATILNICTTARNFVDNYYVPDVLAVASVYPEYAAIGGFDNLLCVGEFPLDTALNTTNQYFPSGIIWGRNISSVATVDTGAITEDVARSWYVGTTNEHPTTGVTDPEYTGIDLEDKYSWLKAPRYMGQPMEVGPLARVMVAFAQNTPHVVAVVNYVLGVTGLTAPQMFSTLGRVAARAIETKVIADAMPGWTNELLARVSGGLTTTRNSFTFPPSTETGVGLNEAPRGVLGHWVQYTNGTTDNYQMVVPSTWNFGPRDAAGVPGPVEQALIGTPVADAGQPTQRPLEILRTVHSFDPCIACAVHVTDLTGNQEPEIAIR